jgi:multidrug efflux pump subunit AcrA (membrane-fusion protein)
MTSVSSPAKDPQESASLSVSLAGSHQESMSAALDDAMDQLDAVVDRAMPDEGTSIENSPALFQLIEAMSSSSSRRDAAAELVGFLTSQFIGCSVRCGLGKGHVTHLLDSRFGWLGPESSVYQRVSKQWESSRQRADEPKDGVTRIIRHEQAIELQLPQPGGTGLCVVWIEAEELPTDDACSWLPAVIKTLGSVFWSRPRRSWPSTAIQMARHTSISIAAAGVLLLILAVWPVHYRVACTAKVETTRQRLVATPFEATLLKTNVKPGDTVKAGDILLELDGRPLRLEREAIEAEIQQVAKEHDVALATRRVADAQHATLRKQQLSRQFDLLSDRLERLEVTSPIDGVVVSGDLEEFVGSPLERGQTLIEVAPMDKMIIEIEIPEYEIGYVSPGAETRVKLDAIGGKSIRLPLNHVYPRAELRDDQNVFVGRIEVDNTDTTLRPGMRGEATTYGPLRPWIWSWVRGGIERALWWVGY